MLWLQRWKIAVKSTQFSNKLTACQEQWKWKASFYFGLSTVVEFCTLICHKIHISQRLLFNNLSFPCVNHLKFIKHHTTQGKFKFGYYLFYCVRVIMHLELIEKWQICGVHALNSVSFGQIYEVLVMPVLIPRLFPWKQGIHIILTHSSIFVFSVFNLWLYRTLYDDSFIYWLLLLN